MTDCYCDYDPPEFCDVRIVKARKQHECWECRGKILPGERYEYTAGLWEDRFNAFHVCERCHDIRVWTANNIPCLCWSYGNMIDDCWEAILAATDRATAETKGLRFGFLRRLVMRNRWNMTSRSP